MNSLMTETQIQGKLAWLCAGLEARRNDIARIVRLLASIGAYAATSFAVHKKFLNLMDQIAEEKEKETNILHEIETVEKHHEEMKRQRRLRRADPDLIASESFRLMEAEEEAPRRSGFWGLVILFLFFSAGARQNPKPAMK